MGIKHGLWGTSEYWTWNTMRQRCINPNNPKYPIYGGRGISVCERWQKFENFIADMGNRPSADHSLDRIDNDGNYEPSNCRWATRVEQQNNQSNTTRLEFQGETLTIHQWATRLGIKAKTIDGRLRSGWSVEDALSHPLMAGGDKRWRTPKNSRAAA